MKPVALTIAGSDPSGGAGIQADLKTFHQFGVYGEAVVTLLTVQNTLASSDAEVTADLIRLYKALGGGWDPQVRESETTSVKQ